MHWKTNKIKYRSTEWLQNLKKKKVFELDIMSLSITDITDVVGIELPRGELQLNHWAKPKAC